MNTEYYGKRLGEVFLGMMTVEGFLALPFSTKRYERTLEFFFYQTHEIPCYPVFIHQEELKKILETREVKP